MRMFIALEIPSEKQDRVRREIKRICGLFAGGRTVPMENLHVTLFFAGECDPHVRDALQSALREAYTTAISGSEPLFPMRVRLGAPGLFKNRDKRKGGAKRTLWMSAGPGDALSGFRHMLAEALASHGIEAGGGRPFHPHMTIARDVPPLESGNSAEWSERVNTLDAEPLSVTVSGPVLFESVSRPGGVSYLVRYRPG